MWLYELPTIGHREISNSVALDYAMKLRQMLPLCIVITHMLDNVVADDDVVYRVRKGKFDAIHLLEPKSLLRLAAIADVNRIDLTAKGRMATEITRYST
nr:hypothetical protein [Thioalkalivibrio sp. XN279]